MFFIQFLVYVIFIKIDIGFMRHFSSEIFTNLRRTIPLLFSKTISNNIRIAYSSFRLSNQKTFNIAVKMKYRFLCKSEEIKLLRLRVRYLWWNKGWFGYAFVQVPARRTTSYVKSMSNLQLTFPLDGITKNS